MKTALTKEWERLDRALYPDARTVDQVRASLAAAARHGTDGAFAALMLKHGRLTDEARRFVEAYSRTLAVLNQATR